MVHGETEHSTGLGAAGASGGDDATGEPGGRGAPGRTVAPDGTVAPEGTVAPDGTLAADHVTIAGDDVVVTTTERVLDQGFSFTGAHAALVYDTTVVGGVHDGFSETFTSRDDATAGHARVVDALRSTAADEEPPPAEP